MDLRIRSGTIRPARAMPAESQAEHCVRHVAKAPANPFLSVYEMQCDTCQVLARLTRPLVETIPARDRHPTGLLDLSDRARLPTKGTPGTSHPPDRFSMGTKCESSTRSTGSAISTRSFCWRVSGRDTESACACQILTRCQRH